MKFSCLTLEALCCRGFVHKDWHKWNTFEVKVFLRLKKNLTQTWKINISTLNSKHIWMKSNVVTLILTYVHIRILILFSEIICSLVSQLWDLLVCFCANWLHLLHTEDSMPLKKQFLQGVQSFFFCIWVICVWASTLILSEACFSFWQLQLMTVLFLPAGFRLYLRTSQRTSLLGSRVNGSRNMWTGMRNISLLEPSAWQVLEPSKFHSGMSETE